MWFWLACDDATEPVPSGPPDWYADVQPLIQTHCAGCHNQTDSDTLFDDPDLAVAWAPAMAAQIRAGRMPPAAPDPSCRSYVNSEQLNFPDQDRETILAWADAGAPLGDPETAPPASKAEAPVPPDVVLAPAEPYTYDFTQEEQYLWCFDVELDIGRDTWIQSLNIDPGDARFVHHVVVFQVTQDTSVLHFEGGANCDDYGDFSRHIAGAWAGGSWPVAFPEGTALPAPAGTTFVLQVHFEGKAEQSGGSVSPSVGLTLSDQPEHELVVVDEPGPAFVLPANETEWSFDLTHTWEDARPFHAVTVGGHMHQLGSALQMNRTGPAGTDCMLDSTPWDFRRQVFVTFDEPVVYRQGDEYGWRCTWDNSATNPLQYNSPPQDIPSGLDTHQEMCSAATFGWLE